MRVEQKKTRAGQNKDIDVSEEKVRKKLAWVSSSVSLAFYFMFRIV